MKKNVLALSIAAMIGGLGFAGAASADVIRGTGTAWAPGTGTDGVMTASTDNAVLEIADAGTGHMLLMPYFNAQNNNMTVLHVVNTDTSNGKAVKVRFRSAANSDDILDFQVFMSPADVWTAAVSAGPDGIAQITTADGTCTVPKLAKGVAQPFVTDRLNPNIAAADKANQTREGYVEIFNMADIRSDRIYQNVGATALAASPLYTAIKHVNGVAPCATAGSTAETTLFGVATNNFTTQGAAAFAGLDTPTGGLLGDWYIINTAQTTTFSGGATSISAKTAFGASGASARGSFVHFPQIDTAVDAASMLRYSADPLFRTDAYYNSTVANPSAVPAVSVGRNTVAGQNLAGAFYDLPDMSTPYVTDDVNANSPKIQAAVLTRALAVTSLTNQYATDASISAKTDWVFSMPTRRYNVAANYSAVANGATAQNAPTYRLFTDLEQAGTLPGNPGNVPATPNWFVPANTSVDVLGNICVNSDGQRLWDREETTAGTTGIAPVFSPRTPGVPSVVRFCGEVSVLQFKDEGTSVLGASVARTTLTNPGFDNGWGLISTNNVVANNAGTSSTAVGLPILGFGVQRLTNPNVGNGVSGNFGITWPHRNTRLIAQ